MPPAGQFNVDFFNRFFNPKRKGYKKNEYLAALKNPASQQKPLTDRIDELGLLKGKPEQVKGPLMEWFALWSRVSAARLVSVLHDAVKANKRVMFVYRRTDAPVEVAVADFPTDPVTVIIRGVHP